MRHPRLTEKGLCKEQEPTCNNLSTISRETFSPVHSAPAAPEGPFHHLLLIQPGPSSPRWPW